VRRLVCLRVYIRALARINVREHGKRDEEEREERRDEGAELTLNTQKLPHLQYRTSHLRQLASQPLYVSSCKSQPHTTIAIVSFIVYVVSVLEGAEVVCLLANLTQSCIPK
jgi:hypothetical protein